MKRIYFLLSTFYFLLCLPAFAQGPNVRVLNATTPAGSPFPLQVSGSVSASGNIGGYTKRISNTPTISTTAYSAGMVVGGVQTLSNAFRTGQTSGVLQSCGVLDKDHQNAAFQILIFDTNPSNGTYTDHAALTLNATDATHLIRVVTVAASDYQTLNSGYSFADPSTVAKPVTAVSGTTLWAIVVTTGTPTYTTTTSLAFNFGILED